MLVWSAVFGAFAGWLVSELEGWGFVLGGILGLLGGWIFRRAVRAEIANAITAIEDRLGARFDALDTQAAQMSRDMARPAPTTPLPAAQRARATPIGSASNPPSPPEPVAIEPAAPAEPSALAAALAHGLAEARRWLLGGNTVVRVGLVMLFVGLAFLASYASSAGLFPVELRLATVAAAGAALLGLGFRTRERRPGFGLALQGGGVAAIYLALFGAAKVVDGFPLGVAFALMVLVCAMGSALALLQRSQALAATAFAGGFATPLLLSTGGGDIAGLFGFYTILNVAILIIATRHSWRVLNLLGFFPTFGVASLWMAAGYTSDRFMVTQAFVLASVLIYLATALLYARAAQGRYGAAVDTTLLFGPALAGFGLEMALVGDRPFGSAFAALGFGALYLCVAAFAMGRRSGASRVMSEGVLAIGVGFVTMAVPLALGARWTSAAWALEGAGAFWVGMRQARWVPRLFGLTLQLVAAMLFLGGSGLYVVALPLANAGFVGAVLIALAGLATAWWLRRDLPTSGSRLGEAYAGVERSLARPAFLFGFAFWWLAWVAEANRHLPPGEAGRLATPVFVDGVRRLLAMLAFVVSAFGFQALGRRRDWAVATWPSHASLLALGLTFLDGVGSRHVLYTPDWIIWSMAIGLHLWMLRLNDGRVMNSRRPWLVGASHVGGVWLGTAMLADCLWLGVDQARLWRTSWAGVVFLASVTAALVALTLWAGRAMSAAGGSRRWPIDRHAIPYGWTAALPIAALVAGGALATTMAASGRADPLPFLPLLNPVDVTVALALAALALWRRGALGAVPEPAGANVLRGPGAVAAWAGLAFIWVNTAWLRTAHRLLGVGWDGDALFGSVVVQAGLAILWTLLALPLMAAGHRWGRRSMWLVGAGLLGLTVGKLLLVDLNATGGAARIVAFIVVGLLMLVVGYLAPLPPKADDREPEGALA